MSSLICGDCFVEMPKIADNSIDMILCDLPYGITNCKWDSALPLDKLWQEYKRLVKPTTAIVLFADEPFTSLLVTSNLKNFKYKITWDKDMSGGFLNANIMPMKQTEDICVFGFGSKTNYYPIMRRAQLDRIRPKTCGITATENYGEVKVRKMADDYDRFSRYPTNIIKLSRHAGECNPLNIVHPTQKPVALFEYLIKTYSKEGDTVLDNCAGSGTTAVACRNLNRKYICIEKEEKYFRIMKERVADTTASLLFYVKANGYLVAKHE